MLRYLLLIVGLIVLALLIRLGVSGDLSQGGSLKTLMIPLATLYLDAFNSSSTAIALCFGMVAAGVGVFLYYWLMRIAPARNDLRMVAAELRASRERGTKEALDRVDQIMSRHPTVLRGWSLYRATLGTATDGRVASRIPPVRYFDMRMLEGTGVRLRFFLGLPNDFVGLGLIFTFMGLVAGLYFASRSMMSADLNVAREALVQLLHAATFKFLTSITGIGLSLVLSWAQSILLDGLRGALADIQFLLEERFPMNAEALSIGSGPALEGRRGTGFAPSLDLLQPA